MTGSGFLKVVFPWGKEHMDRHMHCPRCHLPCPMGVFTYPRRHDAWYAFLAASCFGGPGDTKLDLPSEVTAPALASAPAEAPGVAARGVAPTTPSAASVKQPDAAVALESAAGDEAPASASKAERPATPELLVPTLPRETATASDAKPVDPFVAVADPFVPAVEEAAPAETAVPAVPETTTEAAQVR